MERIDTSGGVKPPSPWRAILLPTIGLGAAAGGAAGAAGTFALSPLFWMLFPFCVVVGALVGLITASVGLVIGAATWGLLGSVPLSSSLRASVAVIVPAAAATAAWFRFVVPAIFTDGAQAFTVVISVAIVITAVVLPWRIRRRFLDTMWDDTRHATGRLPV